MKINKMLSNFFLFVGCSSFLFNSLGAGITSSGMKEELSKYFEAAPYLGLLADEVEYGPIKVSHVHIHDGEKFVIAAPGDILNGSLRYHINAENLEFMHKYYLVIGLKEQGAQECVTHSRGIWDTKGKAHFKLTVPKKPGVYEVRFLFVEGANCQAAQKLWNSGVSAPGAYATIGVIIVE